MLAAQPGVELAAVCDVDEGRAGAIARRAGARAFGDWEAMLAAVDIDALFVCTPPVHHAAPTLAAFERGVAVYLEKPLARSLPDGEAIAAAWRASRRRSARSDTSGARSTCSRSCARSCGASRPGLLVSRSYGPTEAARRDLDDARMGSRPEWRGRRTARAVRRRAGQRRLLFELASHDVDLQIALAGPWSRCRRRPAVACSRSRGHPPSALDDAVALLLRFADGGLGAVHVAWNPAQRPPLYALDLHARTSRSSSPRPDFVLRGRAHGADIAVTGVVGPRTSSVVQFLAAARGGDPASVACSPDDALDTLRAVLACERALASGERVAV